MKTIAIIGAGFSGTLTGVQLLRKATRPLRVLLINERAPMARGLAYGTNSPQHVLNVPVGNMSALADDPGHFLKYCTEAGHAVEATSFVRRDLYGAYLDRLLSDTESSSQASLHRIVGKVVKLTPPPNGRLVFEDGRQFSADRVVLAFGHFAPNPPIDPAQLAALGPAYVSDPWDGNLADRIGLNESVLVVGTGLTALDVVISLHETGHRGPITMLSRRGLTPQSHRVLAAHPSPVDGGTLAMQMGASVRSFVRTLRKRSAAAVEDGYDWRDVIGSIRSFTPALWKRLSLSERRRFLCHVAPYWDVLRHRCAPEAYASFARLRSTGRVAITAGRIQSATQSDGRVTVEIKKRGTLETLRLRVDRIVNCTGSSSDISRCSSPLVRTLLDGSLLVPDPLGLGIEVSEDYCVINRDGLPVPWLRYIGPLLRARDWESTAVPELRVHAQRLAETLLREMV